MADELARDAVRARKLLRAARRGDRGARERLVVSNLKLVRAVASRYRDLGLPFDDLVQEGSLGLLDAIDGYDPSRGTTFESYARFRVRRAIRDALTEQSRLIRLPKHVVERRRALGRAETRLRAAGRAPTSERLAEATGLPLEAVLEARGAAFATVSLDAPILEDGSTLESVLPDPAAEDPVLEVLSRERRALLRDALVGLPERQRRVIVGRSELAGAPRPDGELASTLGLSPRRVQTIGRDALYSLRAALEPADVRR